VLYDALISVREKNLRSVLVGGKVKMVSSCAGCNCAYEKVYVTLGLLFLIGVDEEYKQEQVPVSVRFVLPVF